MLRELELIGFANMLDYINIQDGLVTVDLSELTREQAAAIQEVVVEVGEMGPHVKIKLSDKQKALVKMGEHLGLFKQVVKHEGTIGVQVNCYIPDNGRNDKTD